MLPKPDGCLGCPFYGDGRGFVPDEIRERAPILVLGQNPGEQEEQQGRPFVGKTGEDMDRNWLKLAGITREQGSFANSIRCRFRHTNDLPKVRETVVATAIEHCRRAHGKLPEGARLVISQGDYAALAATSDPSSTEWRGYLVPYVGTSAHTAARHLSEPWVPGTGDLPVLVTVHLARLYRDATLKLATKADWAKASRVLAGRWPRRPPKFLDVPPNFWPKRFAFDTEFELNDDYSGRLHRYSLSVGTGDGQTTVVEADAHVRPRFLEGVRPNAITQYAPADIRQLSRLSGVGLEAIFDTFLIDDTVFKHGTLYPDMDHNLNFLGSIYASFNRWKHLSDADPQGYAGCDSLGTLEVDNALNLELQRDPTSLGVYEGIDRPTIQDFVEAQYAGIRVDQERREQVEGVLEKETQDARARAIASAGWSINVGSSEQVSAQLFTVEGLKPPRLRRR